MCIANFPSLIFHCSVYVRADRNTASFGPGLVPRAWLEFFLHTKGLIKVNSCTVKGVSHKAKLSISASALWLDDMGRLAST